MENLRRYLKAACKSASVLVVGEAAGPWGARFSGVPFVGEQQLLDPLFPIKGKRSSRDALLMRSNKRPPFISNSAKMFWEILLPYRQKIVAWDAFPFHSHKRDDCLTVRNPTAQEVRECEEMLRLLKEFLQPAAIVAVGRRAYDALVALGESPIYVRHPSRGGKARFAGGLRGVFNP